MTARTFTVDVPESIVNYDPEDESREREPIPVTFEWSPGQEATGTYGPPENYDPGCPDEFNVVSHDWEGSTLDRVIDWIDEHWERPDDECPDPDWLRDMEREAL